MGELTVHEGNRTINELRELVKRSSRSNPHLTSRLEKGASLLLLRGVKHMGRGRYQVGSEDGLRDYDIVNGHCQCHDYVRHGRGHACKHRLALALHMELLEASASDSVLDGGNLFGSAETSPG